MGPFAVRLTTSLSWVARHVQQLYADFPLLPDETVVDAEVSARASGWCYRRISLFVDGSLQYPHVPRGAAIPLLEWTLNRCVFHRPSTYLILHAAVVERHGAVVILPGDTGAGKSTLCAALMHRGWRLFSDEVALVRPGDGQVVPAPRPVSLKEDSIEKIRDFAPDAVMGPVWPETPKGRLAHLLPTRASVLRMEETAPASLIVFPSFAPGTAAQLEAVSKADAFLECAAHAFNYIVLGRTGFLALADLISGCDCHGLVYGDLEEAVNLLESLHRCDRRPRSPAHDCVF